ncbi:hypothetical protein VMCG_07550 [Cytospora schulzeri]|uniref:Late sexual development protein n=1 Tax=Cytospora schulzeri TaxID=448051 RepID=A0A423VX57_9PEZI|nr:hypothetical protein VMCG_07550 [Valsa malicola]
MHFTLITTAALIGLSLSAPAVHRSYDAPADDGFPSPNTHQLATVEQKADGQLTDAPPAPKLAASSLTVFQLIAFNENFEVAFFSSLIENVTNNVPGYSLATPEKKDELLSILTTVKAQEELHAINALDILNQFGVFAPEPCSYKFPVSDLRSAIMLAEIFTSVVLGTLQDASQLLAANGDSGPVRSVASVIGQEGEQNGWYRSFLGLKPSEKPFLTTSVAAFAFSSLQQFVDNCPFDSSEIDIPIFPPLSVLSGMGGADVDARDQKIKFEADLSDVDAEIDKHIGGDGHGLYITYLTGQNLPISEPVSEVSWDGKVIRFEALFPFTENVMEGLSIAALTTSGNFSAADDLPSATIAAPGLIQVNDKLPPSGVPRPNLRVLELENESASSLSLGNLNLTEQAFPQRPGFGTQGKRALFWANFVELSVDPESLLYIQRGTKLGPADTLEDVMQSLSYISARSTKPVFVCAPADYADLACERARCYLSRFFDPSARSESGMSQRSGREEDERRRVQFQQQINLHKKTEDVMVYI